MDAQVMFKADADLNFKLAAQAYMNYLNTVVWPIERELGESSSDEYDDFHRAWFEDRDLEGYSEWEQENRRWNLMFSRYREKGNEAVDIEELDAKTPNEWMLHPFPLWKEEGTRNYKTTGEWRREEYSSKYNYDRIPFEIDEEPDLYDPRYFDKMRVAHRAARLYFHQPSKKIKLGRVLGYGNWIMDIRMYFLGPRSGFQTKDYVLRWGWRKVADPRIRQEQRILRQLRGSYHSRQSVDPLRLGLGEQRPFAKGHPVWEGLDEYDSDFPPEDSSGEEGPPDTPPPVIKTRKELMESLPLLFKGKIEMHLERLRDRLDWLQMRDDVIKHGPHDPADPYDWKHMDYILFEHANHGSLAGLIERLIQQNETVPNRVLWCFWHCLVKAIIGMEYPTRKFHPWRRNETNLGTGLSEEIPASDNLRKRGKRLVHMNIQPAHIFIDDLSYFSGTREHAMVPGLRIGDHTRTKQVKANKSNLYYTNLRTEGTYGFYAPEQFGVEWDHIATLDPNGWEVSESQNAGSFGPWTNIWGIAITMWTLITKMLPPVPPQRSTDPNEPVHYCALLLDDPKYAYIDPLFREILMRCMRHDYWERPTLEQLQISVNQGLPRMYEGETDAFITGWVKRMVCGSAEAPYPNSQTCTS
ncbi:hypothetical protein GGS26DRAFT_302223 [Hypomontagnella submonticulosa]|nr:hypothetical protein GGS26DRAFT_302223 [Hypomontagnella submonticulosa]